MNFEYGSRDVLQVLVLVFVTTNYVVRSFVMLPTSCKMHQQLIVYPRTNQQHSTRLELFHRGQPRPLFSLTREDEDGFSPLEAADRLQSTLNELDDLLLVVAPPDSQPLVVQQTAENNMDVTVLDIQQPIQKVADLAILGLGTYAMTSGIEQLLIQFEWFQTWRYLWPLLGALFAIESVLPGKSSSGGEIHVLPFRNDNLLWRLSAAIGGIGLIVGGAYDAFMPIWETGPNVLTSAGIGQDSAMILLLISIYATVARDGTEDQSKDSKNPPPATSTGVLLQMILLGQLSVLAEGSTEEVIARLSDILSMS